MVTQNAGRVITAVMDTAQMTVSAPGASTVAAVNASATKYVKFYYLGSHLTTLAGSNNKVDLRINVAAGSGFSTSTATISDISINEVTFGANAPIALRNGAAYRYGFNGMERDDEVKGSGNSYDFGARIYDSRLGRWLSLDPLQAKYPCLSPYHSFANSPISVVDPDGKENIIYFVILPNAASKLTIEQKDEIVRKANEILHKKLGVTTKVQLFTGDELFDPKHIDKSDSYMVLGSKNELNAANSSKPLYNPDGGSKYTNAADSRGLSTQNPEQSDGGDREHGKHKLDQGGVIQLEGVSGFSKLAKASITDGIAFILVHGASLNAYGSTHPSGSILATGDEIMDGILNDGKTLGDYEKDNESGSLKKAFDQAHGAEQPVDNYEKNKSSNDN